MSEPFVPYDRAAAWSEHDAYYARGVGAWTRGEIPFLSTSNHAAARQQAAIVTAHVQALTGAGMLAPDEPVVVLEVGGGLGTFAANFHHALDADLGDAGRHLAARLRYLFSDYAEAIVTQASSGELEPLIAAGRVVPALYDVRAPDALRPLRGGPPPSQVTAVLANYICCALPGKHVQRRRDGLLERIVTGEGAEAKAGWQPVEAAALFAEPLHQRVLERVLGNEPVMTVSVPYVFLDFLVGIRKLLHPHGLISVTDYGKVNRADLLGLREPNPTLYGSSLNHDVHFPALDAFAELTGTDAVRTTDPLLSVHTMLLSPEALPPALLEAFQAHFIGRHDGQELLDMVAAGRTFLERADWTRAVRFFGRAIDLDPRNPELRLRLGLAHLEAGRFQAALAALRAGAALERWGRHDFDFEMARAHSKLGEYPDAIRLYEASLARAPHPTTYTNLGSIHETLGHERAAYQCYKRALVLDPADPTALERMNTIKEAFWARRVLELEDLS